MLTDALIEQILARLPGLTIGVFGDLFLDRYLDIDAALTEPSIETGLDAYQVVRIRSCPGAAGTVINNLAALGVGRIVPISFIGDDGEGYELRQALAKMPAVDATPLITAPDRRTPTYTKPLLHQAGQPSRELNRLDIKNRTPTPERLQELLLRNLDEVWPKVDALLVVDQVSEAECGVVTTPLRTHLTVLGQLNPDKLMLADSRKRIHLFSYLSVKINWAECEAAVNAWGHPTVLHGGKLSPVRPMTAQEMVEYCAARFERPVFCTCGEFGLYLASRREDVARASLIPAYPVPGPIDPVGAGDSTMAGIACAVVAGASLEQAAAFGNLVASITVQQLGTTGTASPTQVRQRWHEVRGQGNGGQQEDASA
jgi:bifunctional ADP-heptose synthase (sugar kinase/adenylyltransferase)